MSWCHGIFHQLPHTIPYSVDFVYRICPSFCRGLGIPRIKKVHPFKMDPRKTFYRCLLLRKLYIIFM